LNILILIGAATKLNVPKWCEFDI